MIGPVGEKMRAFKGVAPRGRLQLVIAPESAPADAARLDAAPGAARHILPVSTIRQSTSSKSPGFQVLSNQGCNGP